MSRNSPEYCSIVKATGKLTRALKNNITPICADLVSNHLITPDQQKKLRNPTRDAIESAADLVQLLTDKVEENPANYHTLVRILEEDKTTYRDVLERLALPSDSTPGPHAGKSADISSDPVNDDYLVKILTALDKAQSGQEGEIVVFGRTIRFKAKWRFHSIREPMVWDSTALDVETGIEVEVKHKDTDKYANQLAVEKLCKELKSRGIL